MKTTTRFNLRRGQNMILLDWKTVLATALCAAAYPQLGLAQVEAPSILQIDIANHVLYLEDSDVSKFGTDPHVTTTVHVGNFQRGSAIADIVAVNGPRVMGTHTKGPGGALSTTSP